MAAMVQADSGLTLFETVDLILRGTGKWFSKNIIATQRAFPMLGIGA
jgi:hypothetical protein